MKILGRCKERIRRNVAASRREPGIVRLIVPQIIVAQVEISRPSGDAAVTGGDDIRGDGGSTV